MLRVHKIKLDPNQAQAIYFARACGVARFAYNWALAEWKAQYDAGGKPSETALRKQLNGITGDGCPKSESCARHVSIRWDAFDARISATYRLCEPATFEHYIPAYAEGQP